MDGYQVQPWITLFLNCFNYRRSSPGGEGAWPTTHHERVPPPSVRAPAEEAHQSTRRRIIRLKLIQWPTWASYNQ